MDDACLGPHGPRGVSSDPKQTGVAGTHLNLVAVLGQAWTRSEGLLHVVVRTNSLVGVVDGVADCWRMSQGLFNQT